MKQKIIDLALSQVGYKEGKNNYNKYAEELDKEPYFCTKKQNLAWCAVFVCWLFVIVLGSGKKARKMLYQPLAHKNNLAAVCKYFANYFKNAHRWYKTPEVGDVVFFKGGGEPIGHVGIVVQVMATTIITVEGNHGDRVARVVRKRSECVGFGRPDWNEEPEGGKFTVEVRELKYVKGNVMKGEDVKSIQKIVGCDPDGSYGPATKAAVIVWQRANMGSTEADGIVGPKTYAAMFKAG